MLKTSTTTLFFWLGLTACASSPETPPGMSQQPLDSPGPVPDAGAVANEPSGGAVGDVDAEGDKSGGGGDYTVGEPVFVTGPARLREALEIVNNAIRTRQLPARVLTVPALEAWFRGGAYFQWTKPERQLLDEQFAARQLPAGWTLSLEQIVGLPGDPWRINLCGPEPEDGGWRACNTVSEGTDISDYLERARSICQDGSRNLCEEPFVGPLPAPVARPLPPHVQIRIQAMQVPGQSMQPPEYTVRDALDVLVRLTPRTLPALTEYFGVGYDRCALRTRLRTLLGADTSKWVHLQELLFGWVRERANTFPLQDENDVCHGVARQFYSDVLHNESGYDRSTEAADVLLHDHYCRIADDARPSFGDYFYAPGSHSTRYVLKDPASGRDIVFSVQSGGASAYRFYWADEDMSLNPFAHQPMPDYRVTRVDVWRRCR